MFINEYCKFIFALCVVNGASDLVFIKLKKGKHLGAITIK
jgi:hypothetical protein